MTEVQRDQMARAQALNDMTPRLQESAKFFEQKLARENRGVLLIRHDLGLKLNEIIQEEAAYGSAAVEQLARYLGEKPDTLYKLRNFGKTYDRSQIEQWA